MILFEPLLLLPELTDITSIYNQGYNLVFFDYRVDLVFKDMGVTLGIGIGAFILIGFPAANDKFDTGAYGPGDFITEIIVNAGPDHFISPVTGKGIIDEQEFSVAIQKQDMIWRMSGESAPGCTSFIEEPGRIPASLSCVLFLWH